MPLQLKPLSPHTGVEATGVDLRQALSEGERLELNKAFVEHSVLVIRN